MLPVNERILESEKVVVIVLIVFAIELRHRSSVSESFRSHLAISIAYQVQNRHLHHALVKVGCFVFDHFHSHHFLCLHVLALHNLAKGPLAQHVKNEVAIPGAG